MDQLVNLLQVCFRFFILSPSPGRCIKNDLLILIYIHTVRLHFTDHFFPAVFSILEQLIISRESLFQDLAFIQVLKFIGLLISGLSHIRTGRNQIICTQKISCRISLWNVRTRDIKSHILQRSSMPGVQINLFFPFQEIAWETYIIDQIFGNCKRFTVFFCLILYESYIRILFILLNL